MVAIARTKCAKWTSRRCTHAHMSLWSVSLIPHRRPSSLQCSFLRYSRVESPRSSLLSMQRAIRTSRRVRVGRSGSILASDKLQCGVPMLCAAPPPGDGGMAASFVRPPSLVRVRGEERNGCGIRGWEGPGRAVQIHLAYPTLAVLPAIAPARRARDGNFRAPRSPACI